VNRKPELESERQIEASISLNPSVSDAENTTTGFLPGGSGGTAQGNRFGSTEFELDPGQDVTFELENDTDNQQRMGFTSTLFETVVR